MAKKEVILGEGGAYFYDEEEEGEEECCFDPFCTIPITVKKPCGTCCCLCSMMIFVLVAIGGLLAAGVDIIRFSNDVPFYWYEHETYKAEVALRSAKDTANFRLGGRFREREFADTDFALWMVYELDEDGTFDDTLLEPSILMCIRDLEATLQRSPSFTTFCALTYDFDDSNPICLRPSSVINIMDPAFFIPAGDSTAASSPTVASVENRNVVLASLVAAGFDESTVQQSEFYIYGDPYDAEMEMDESFLESANVAAITEYWAKYCSSADGNGCTAGVSNTDTTPFALTFQDTNITVPNLLSPRVQGSFGTVDGDGNLEQRVRAMTSVLSFGSPQVRDESTGELYETDTSGREDMIDNLGKFLFDTYHDLLSDYRIPGVNIFWTGNNNGMEAEYTAEVQARDTGLIVGSFILIALFLMWQLRSWFLGLLAFLLILGNFGPAIVLYRILFGSAYFGTLNLLAVFILLGVGADDVFLFANTWNEMRNHASYGDSVTHQLRHTLRRGGKAMAVTSLTTMVAFLTNATSSFPAIQSFGIFAAMLIFVNFCSVVTTYPAGMMVYEYYINDPKRLELKRETRTARRRAGGGRGGRLGSILSGCIGRATDICQCCTKKPRGYAPQPMRDAAEAAEVQKPATEVFFREKYFPFLNRAKYIMLAVFAAIFVLYCVCTSFLVPDPDAPTLLPDSDQYIQSVDKLQEYFANADDIRTIVQVPFGLLGVDRGDCDGSKCDPTLLQDLGAPVWDEAAFTMEAVADVNAQHWMLDFCAALASDAAPENLLIQAPSDAVPEPVTCLHTGFKTWCAANSTRCPQTDSTLAEEDYIIDADAFPATLLTYLESEVDPGGSSPIGSTYADVYVDNIRATSELEVPTPENPATLRYMVVEVQLQTDFTYNFEDGQDLYKAWKAYVAEWVDRAATDTDVYGTAIGPVYASGFVGDELAFHYFYLQDKIITEATNGILISLAVAFLIMCVANHNWIISMVATLTIGTMVLGVMTFTVLGGWKLGIIEAVIYVMVVGFSVDYTVHLSDSYLESPAMTREDRTRDMLGMMGSSVLNGAGSTLRAVFPLLFAYTVFFTKFGSFLFFLIFQSVVFSLVPFSAYLAAFGPEQRWGAKAAGKKGKLVHVRRPKPSSDGNDLDETSILHNSSSASRLRDRSSSSNAKDKENVTAAVSTPMHVVGGEEEEQKVGGRDAEKTQGHSGKPHSSTFISLARVIEPVAETDGNSKHVRVQLLHHKELERGGETEGLGTVLTVSRDDLRLAHNPGTITFLGPLCNYLACCCAKCKNNAAVDDLAAPSQ